MVWRVRCGGTAGGGVRSRVMYMRSTGAETIQIINIPDTVTTTASIQTAILGQPILNKKQTKKAKERLFIV